MRKEIIVTLIIAAFLLACRFIITKPVRFSALVSVLIVVVMALAFLVILILTLRGRLIERRVVFLFVGVSLVLPFFMQLPLPVQTSPEVQHLFNRLAQLPPGAKVLAAYDYDPPSAPELQPMADAFMKYAFDHDLKVIIMGLWPQGPQQANLSVEAAFEANPELRSRIRDGVDYVNLGFQSGNEFVVLRMGESFKSMFQTDQNYIPYDSIPLLKNVRNFSNVDLGIEFSAGKPGTAEWVQIAVDRHRLPLASGNTAVQAPMAYPYLNSGQLVGLMGGMTGAAEFERLTGKPGKAATYLLSQTFAHVVVMLFIVIGNVAFFRAREEKQ